MHKYVHPGMMQLTPHLIPQCICYVQQLETVDQYHGEGGGTAELHLFHQHAKVYDHLREKNREINMNNKADHHLDQIIQTTSSFVWVL